MTIHREFNPEFGPSDMYRRLVENLHVGVYVADPRGDLIYVNAAFAGILGYSSKKEMIGLNLADQLYSHPGDRRQFIEKMMKVGFVQYHDVEQKRQDGAVVILSVTSNIILSERNEIIGIEGVVHDITEQKLQNDFNILKRAIEYTADNVMITDKEGVIEYINSAFEATTGFTRQDALGKTPKILKSGKQTLEYYQRLWTTIKSGQVFHAQTMNKKKNGEFYIADQTISPIMHESQVTHFVSVWKDITEKVRLEERLKAEKEKLEEVIGFDEKISSIRKSDKLLDFVVNKTLKILGAQKCSIMLIEKEHDELYVKASVGFGDAQPMRIKIKDSLAARVISDGQPLLINHASPPTRKNKSVPLPSSLMVAPLKLDGEIIGIINVSDKQSHLNEGGSFDELDLKILCDIAREVAVAMENVRFYKELQFLTITDPVTNIHNFRHFINSLEYEIKRIKRIPGDLALMMIDIDDFKAYNDEFGQPVGDRLLKEVGRIIKNNIREVDILCRYAGDEFVLILPGSEKSGSATTAERIRIAVEHAPLPKPVTISIGVTQYRAAMSGRDLTVKSDRALYQAKREGKNKICFF